MSLADLAREALEGKLEEARRRAKRGDRLRRVSSGVRRSCGEWHSTPAGRQASARIEAFAEGSGVRTTDRLNRESRRFRLARRGGR
jgi:hypothetical protein